MPCNSTNDPLKDVTLVKGTVISGHDLRPGDKFRALGPVQTVMSDGNNYGVLHAKPGDFHYVGSPTSPAPTDTAKEFILIERAVRFPSYWPAQPGDVWRNTVTGIEYFVGSNRGGSFLLSVSDVEKLIKSGSKFELRHRRGRKLGSFC